MTIKELKNILDYFDENAYVIAFDENNQTLYDFTLDFADNNGDLQLYLT